MTPNSLKILVLAPYPFGKVASQRFRFEQYWDVWQQTGASLTFRSFFSENAFHVLYQKGHVIQKLWGVITGLLRRVAMLFTLGRYDLVFIHREAAPLGPPMFEWLIAHVFRKKVIYDFDDAIWLGNTSSENRVAALLKCHWKVGYICQWSSKVLCGNDFLADYARQFACHVEVVPTTLNLEGMPLASHACSAGMLTIGWTGTHSTLKYLQALVPMLQDLEKKQAFRFVVIADKDPQLPLKNYQFLPWKKETEWTDLSQLDIGLMPLGNSEWEEGKCGFKALQYMALGIPALASPTRANEAIITNGENGGICKTSHEWAEQLLALVQQPLLYEAYALRGRAKVETHYSKKAWQERYQAFLQVI